MFGKEKIKFLNLEILSSTLDNDRNIELLQKRRHKGIVS
jgi:hypothetical protein